MSNNNNNTNNNINPRMILGALVVVVFVFLVLSGKIDLGGNPSAPTGTQGATEAIPIVTGEANDSSATTEAPPESHVARKAYYFRSKSLLDSHYDKHGKEMGFKSAKEYEAAASAVINDPRALYKTEKEDGDHVFYIEETNEFVVLSQDGYIRTYFLPDAGKKYFDKQ